jgi:hypothetical protein
MPRSTSKQEEIGKAQETRTMKEPLKKKEKSFTLKTFSSQRLDYLL